MFRSPSHKVWSVAFAYKDNVLGMGVARCSAEATIPIHWPLSTEDWDLLADAAKQAAVEHGIDASEFSALSIQPVDSK
jgi:hypothetical protein